MLTVLLESRATPSRHLGGTVLSTLAHGAAIAAVVTLTLPARDSDRRVPDLPVAPVRYVQPASPTAEPARRIASPPPRTDGTVERPTLPVIDVPVLTPTRIPPIDLASPNLTPDAVLLGGHSRPPGGSGTLGAALGGPEGVSDASAVDRPPRILGRAAQPRYPAPLRSAGIEGLVLAEFVVDTLGRAELTTLRFPELANPLFGDAVREALGRYRFQPGEVAGRKVRTRVAVPFEFRLARDR